MHVDMSEVGGANVLAGAPNGKAALSKLLERIATEPAEPEPVFLDFRDVDVATASYLRESVVAFRNVVRGRDSLYYPILANLNNSVRDDLLEIALGRGDVFMTCVIAEDGIVVRSAIVGELEAKQQQTFDLVAEHGETDAGELMRKYGHREKTRHTTAWNNRLSSLASIGLIVEMRQGRLKRYRPLFEETV